jgi:AraC-like DNA-binding protein/quercetin dioxygenase-like cupin family protein
MAITPEPDYFSRQVRQATRFFRNPGVPGEEPRVVAGGLEVCAPGYSIERADFGYAAIEFVVAGTGTLHLEGREYGLDPGTVFFYGPGVPHRITLDDRERLEKYFVNATGPFAGPRVVHIARPRSLVLSFEELLEYGRDPSPRADEVCASLYELIVTKVGASALEHGNLRSSAFETYRRCKETIAGGYGGFASLAEAAGACGVDEAYLCRIFARFDHQSPYRYLLGLRMNHAADLILSGEASVKEAARALGYTDQGHFSRTFKRVLGVSPSRMNSTGPRY